MKYVRLYTKDPYYNLAVEEYLFRNADDDVFMLWQNEPSVIVGKNQNAYAEVNLDYAQKNGINVCRRITGGGAVYHDLGNINYTLISTRGDAQALDFEFFTRPIRNALSRLGIECQIGARNDIECRGVKFSGNAQHCEGGRILHHGTLLFNSNFDTMESVLKVDKEKLAHRAVKSCRARVVNLSELIKEKITLSDFISSIEQSVCSELCATAENIEQNEEITSLYRRNKTNEWIFSDKRFLTNYLVERKKKYPFGLVKLQLKLEDGLISDISLSGDFFSTSPVEELERLLIGVDPNSPCEIDPSPYISGMSFAEIKELLAQ